jgi:hypothetical protein
MGDILQFKRPSLRDKAEGKTLCKRGFHKWAPDPKKQFDSRKGKLVSIMRCKRCGAVKTTTT